MSDIEKGRPAFPTGPLVSVVITNFNYAAYIEDAVRSVMRQTYPDIECVVVDDCSSDTSCDIIRSLQKEYQNISLIKNDRNLGQSASIARGIEATSGEYVVLLDSDDFLLNTFVECHIATHLSLRRLVGFTSSDMVEVSKGRLVTAGSQIFGDYIKHNPESNADLLRDLSKSPDMKRFATRDLHLDGSVFYVPPEASNEWHWSPTSGNCFRRDALSLIIENPRLHLLRSCTDCYLLRGISVLTGSALIDRPLAAYRVHSRNDFARGAHLNKIRAFDFSYLQLRTEQAIKILIDYFIETAAKLVPRLESEQCFIKALDTLDASYPPPLSEEGSSYLDEQMRHHKSDLSMCLSADAHEAWMGRRSPFIQPRRRLGALLGYSKYKNAMRKLSGGLLTPTSSIRIR